MSPLRIARINNGRIAKRDIITSMNVPQRPILVLFASQVVGRARRVVIVTFRASQRRMEQAQVEYTRHGSRVLHGQVSCLSDVSKALAMNDDTKIAPIDRLRHINAKQFHPFR